MEETNNSDSIRPFRSAIITLVGRPNSGKSSLINTIIGEEVSIVSPLPQTTRLNTRGIYTSDTLQLVFVDTPGIHQGRHTLNHAMLQEARRAIDDSVDLLCYLVDCSRDFGEEERYAATLVAQVKQTPVIIIFNKIDAVPAPQKCIDAFFRLFPALAPHPRISLSATLPQARETFLAAIDRFIAQGPLYFDPDDLTDATMRQIAAEYIRKQVIAATSAEVPHATFVEIDSYRELDGQHNITATIHVETSGQRGIIVGKSGSVITRIKKAARADICRIAGAPVSLTCHVKVSPRWRDNPSFLRLMGVPFEP